MCRNCKAYTSYSKVLCQNCMHYCKKCYKPFVPKDKSESICTSCQTGYKYTFDTKCSNCGGPTTILKDLCYKCENKTRSKTVNCKVKNCTNKTLKSDGICHDCTTTRVKCLCGNYMNSYAYMCNTCLNKALINE
jgi:hypothetical protein